MKKLYIILLVTALVGCSKRPSDVNKTINDVKSAMDTHVNKCGDTYFFSADVENGHSGVVKFRGKMLKSIEDDKEYSDADKANGVQYRGRVSLKVINGVYFDHALKEWRDVKEPDEIAYAVINKSNDKISVNFATPIMHRMLSDDKIDVNNDYKVSCQDLESFEAKNNH